MLKVKELHVKVENREILRGVNLDINPGEIHVIMGPNGSGKSTLASILVGKENYQVTAGTVEFLGKDLLAMQPEERATSGLFLSFQYPVEIAGVNNMFFLKMALNSQRKKRGLPELDTMDLITLVKNKSKILELDENFLQRPLNFGFSGGEKKRNDILQMLVLDPQFAILDEPDSGLDIDAMQAVAKGINSFKSPTKSMLLITHYQRLLNYVVPDYIHVLYQGKIVKSGSKELAQELETKGYGWLDGK